jgi:hypothetical protein
VEIIATGTFSFPPQETSRIVNNETAETAKVFILFFDILISRKSIFNFC